MGFLAAPRTPSTLRWLLPLALAIYGWTAVGNAMRCDQTLTALPGDAAPPTTLQLAIAQAIPQYRINADKFWRSREVVIAPRGGIPNSLTCEGKTYTVTKYLGSGAEGDNFLATFDGKQYVLKRFRQSSGMERCLKELRQLDAHGIGTPPVLASQPSPESDKSVVVFEAVDGIVVSDILNSAHVRGMLTADQIAEVETAFDKFRKSQPDLWRSLKISRPQASGTLFTADGRFVVFDPG